MGFAYAELILSLLPLRRRHPWLENRADEAMIGSLARDCAMIARGAILRRMRSFDDDEKPLSPTFLSEISAHRIV